MKSTSLCFVLFALGACTQSIGADGLKSNEEVVALYADLDGARPMCPCLRRFRLTAVAGEDLGLRNGAGLRATVTTDVRSDPEINVELSFDRGVGAFVSPLIEPPLEWEPAHRSEIRVSVRRGNYVRPFVFAIGEDHEMVREASARDSILIGPEGPFDGMTCHEWEPAADADHTPTYRMVALVDEAIVSGADLDLTVRPLTGRLSIRQMERDAVSFNHYVVNEIGEGGLSFLLPLSFVAGPEGPPLSSWRELRVEMVGAIDTVAVRRVYSFAMQDGAVLDAIGRDVTAESSGE